MKKSFSNPALGIVAVCLLASFVVFAAAPEFREYDGAEHPIGTVYLPVDWDQPAEWTFARLMYPENSCPTRFGRGGYWADGGTSWQAASFVEPQPGRDAWVRWQGSFRIGSGEILDLVCRATDSTGALQTSTFSLPQPDGGSGWHSVKVKGE